VGTEHVVEEKPVNDVTGMPQTAAVIGGGSDLAVEILEQLARSRLRAALLVGPRAASLEVAAGRLRAAGVERVETVELDVTDVDALEGLADDAARTLGAIDLVLVAVGLLGTAELDALDAAEVGRSIAVNFGGPAAAATAFARVLRAQGSGRIVVLSSVAGYRVRRANFVYGAAKAGLDGFAQGLADALAGSGVAVTIVRPGFVHTKMTTGRPVQPFALSAGAVATAVVRGIERNDRVVWAPSFLRPLFGLLRLLPTALWRRLPS
jgi:decaprenylphospho-beta-D-erythro-pentofuranosid-2-ulose 2-reductase